MFKNFFCARFIVAAMLTLALTFLAASPIVSARASYINYKVTSVTNENGRALIHGYFYNTGNAGAYVTQVTFRGYIGNVSIDATFDVNSCYVGANDRVSMAFGIVDGRISSRTSTNANLQIVTRTD